MTRLILARPLAATNPRIGLPRVSPMILTSLKRQFNGTDAVFCAVNEAKRDAPAPKESPWTAHLVLERLA